MTAPDTLEIALLTYRGHPHVGGQGVYVSHLSKALTQLGHRVTVFSGQPYPELPPDVRLAKVPSLDLYRPEDPFRRPARNEFKGPIDVLEYASMCTAAFPEPLTFSLRAARALAHNGRFDVVHDNQCLGYGLLAIDRHTPVVATIHHPISIDRRLDIARATGTARRMQFRRWYSFVRMQARVAKRMRRVIAVSESARDDVTREFGVARDRIGIVHNGVDTDLFRPLHGIERTPGQVMAVASSDLPMKGTAFLIEAIAKVATEREVRLVLVGNGGRSRAVRDAIERFGVEHLVSVEGRVDALRLVELYAQSQVAIVPSIYEGFSLPAIEAMACAVPVVATTGGALPEVIGEDGMLVPPGDAQALAAAIGALLDDPSRRVALGIAGRRRVHDRFTWKAAAESTVDEYREAIRC